MMPVAGEDNPIWKNTSNLEGQTAGHCASPRLDEMNNTNKIDATQQENSLIRRRG